MASTHPNAVATPSYFLIIRIVQAVLAIIILGLTAYEIDIYDGLSYSGSNVVIGGFGVGLFTSILTLILVAYVLLTPRFLPAAYHFWAVVGLEALAVIFWLVTFALFAKITALINSANNYSVDDIAIDECVYYNDCVKKRALHTFAKRSSADTYVDTIYTALAFSIIEWLLFVATFVLFLLTVQKHRRSAAPVAATQPAQTKDLEAQGQPMPSTAAPTHEQPAVQQPVLEQEPKPQEVQQPLH